MVSHRSSDPPRSSRPTAVTEAAQSGKSASGRRAPRARGSAGQRSHELSVSEEVRRGMIAESAYLRAERRGFAPGQETQDWLSAEVEVDALLKANRGGSPQ